MTERPTLLDCRLCERPIDVVEVTGRQPDDLADRFCAICPFCRAQALYTKSEFHAIRPEIG